MSYRSLAGTLLSLVMAACSAGGSGPPTAVVCEVLSWEDPQTVRFPIESGPETLEAAVDVGGLMLVEFSYRDLNLAYDAIDISEGERDFISSGRMFLPQLLDLEEAGEAVVDTIGQHPTVRIEYRILCETA